LDLEQGNFKIDWLCNIILRGQPQAHFFHRGLQDDSVANASEIAQKI
jgi:hypothetical protein